MWYDHISIWIFQQCRHEIWREKAEKYTSITTSFQNITNVNILAPKQIYKKYK